MPDILRIKRRAATGNPGPPASLLGAEIAYNERDDILYYGRGNNGGFASAIIPIAGSGFYTTIVPNVAALRALPTGAMLVFVPGYYATNDGGGGYYARGAAGADNGGTIIVSGNGTYYLQTFGAAVSVRQYGARGDGASDDTAAISAAMATNAAIAFPPGAFVISARLPLRVGHAIQGAGTANTIVIQTVADFAFYYNSGIAIANIRLSDLTIQAGTSGVSGIGTVLAGDVAIKNIQFAGCEANAISFDRGYYSLAENCASIPLAAGNHKAGGFKCFSSDPANFIFYPTLRDCRVHTADEEGVGVGASTPCVYFIRAIGGMIENFVGERLNVPTAGAIDGIQIENNSQGVKIMGGVTYGAKNGVIFLPGLNADSAPGYCVVQNHDVDAFTVAGIDISGTAQLASADITIKDCMLTAPQGSALCITTANLLRLNIEGCTLDQYGAQGGYGIQLSRTNTALVRGNIVSNFLTGIGIVGGVINLLLTDNSIINCVNVLVGDVSAGGLGSNRVKDNVGIGPGAIGYTQPAVPPSGVYITNNTGLDMNVFVYGGNGVTIGLNGVNTGILFSPTGAEPKGGSVRVPANGTVGLHYDAAPAWTWIPDF